MDGTCCAVPELVREYLHAGALVKLIAEKEADLLAMPTKDRELEFCLRNPCYIYLLLGACAMTLGYQLPEPYIAMLTKVNTEGGLMPDALKQMKTALFGPDGYVNGTPYNFESKGLLETADSAERKDPKANKSGFVMMNVPSRGELFNTGMGDSSTSAIIEELRQKKTDPASCGNCGANATLGGKSLLVCARCKDRKYCSVACQKAAWKTHKVCEPARESI